MIMIICLSLLAMFVVAYCTLFQGSLLMHKPQAWWCIYTGR